MSSIIKQKESPENAIIIGIDPSLNGTAIIKMKNFEIIDYIFFTTVKKVGKGFKEATLVDCTGVERLDLVLSKFEEYLKKSKADYIAIEDYAFGAKSNSIFQIGGLGEAMRLIIYRSGIPYQTYEPSKVKKFATGKGNAEKSQMVLQAFKDGFDVGKFGKSGEDLADAYWIAKMLNTEIFIRNNQSYIDNLSKIKASTFTEVSKAFPIPLINRPFILNRGD